MERLPHEVIINDILGLEFPFDLGLLLTSANFYKLQKKYFEYLGCTNKQSKNFLLMLVNTIKRKHKSQKYIFDQLKYNFDDIPFANDTALMDNYLKLATDFMKKDNYAYQNKYRKCDDVNNVRTQIIMLMAHKSMKPYIRKYIPKLNRMVDNEYVHRHKYNKREDYFREQNYVITQLLQHNNNNEQLHLNIEWHNNVKEHNIVKEIVEFSVNIVNVFYAMIGIKSSYSTSYKYVNKMICHRCRSVLGNNCGCCRGFDDVRYCYFYATPNSAPGDYFNNVNWYNKIYSKIKCTEI